MAKESKYGENTKMVSYRVPESKVSEVNKMVKMKLNEYEKNFILNGMSVPMYSEDGYEGELHNLKKSNPADIDIIKSDEIYKVKESTPILKVNLKKDVDMDVLRAIANSKGVKSELFATKKKPIEDEYDFEYVTSLPDADSQVPIGSRGMAFYDRYDLGRFYVRYEGKYLRFENEKEFNRFAKDNLIK
jgi:hypothetical protein